ncbi:hypothetical protein H1D32_22605 [Anaerobacillus sp. CMMVII]|uniref:hypothetical protein n=1 Tax=Anaerobacillus sp. CMMVII TaxID=2755588 RepID=UPI0021B83FDE|nr:hypothetical protein [Anaerobacillus sp. CMMVII]MCT8140242.1 hypothetical protein [Anaerobacillus sp. CMMVII]
MNYGKWSATLSIICAVSLFVSYAIAPVQPEGMIVILLQVLFYGAIIMGFISIILSICAFKNKEIGFP